MQPLESQITNQVKKCRSKNTKDYLLFWGQPLGGAETAIISLDFLMVF